MTQIIFDTRSPKEYEYSHIPGAISCPILDNIERHIVGLTYKKEGQTEAIKKGFEIFFPKFELEAFLFVELPLFALGFVGVELVLTPHTVLS